MAADFGDFEDPTADFLAREQAILGADAALFGNPMAEQVSPVASRFENTQLNGNAFESVETTTGAVDFFSAPIAANTDLLQPHTEPVGVFAQAGIFAQPTEGFPHPDVTFDEKASFDPVVGLEKSQAIIDWQEQFDRKVKERDEKQKEKHVLILHEAKEQLERFYAEYNETKKKAPKKEPEVKSVNIWERIYKQIEKEKSDLSRFKQVLNSLKNDKKAPGLEV